MSLLTCARRISLDDSLRGCFTHTERIRGLPAWVCREARNETPLGYVRYVPTAPLKSAKSKVASGGRSFGNPTISSPRYPWRRFEILYTDAATGVRGIALPAWLKAAWPGFAAEDANQLRITNEE